MNSLGPLDLFVILGTLLGVTLVGGRLAGRQRDVRDFFLGGKSLPWWAVAASIIATEISAVTYVSLPAVVWRPGGNLTYLQIGLIGAVIAKGLVAWLLIPAYFEKEIFSPYDYMGERLGEGVRRTTTVLFSVGGVVAQAARVYLVAVVLEVLMARELQLIEDLTGLAPLASAVICVGCVAVVWTLLGGIAAIVWTDALLFVLFLAGIAVLLISASRGVEGGFAAAMRTGTLAGKTQLFDTTPTLMKPYTLWVAVFAAPLWLLGPYGTDQLVMQRLFSCADAAAARKAMLASTAAVLVTLLVGLVGVVLVANLQQSPPGPLAASLLVEKPDRLIPVYILTSLPDGLRGLVVAGVFAAAISSLDSILSALAQTTSALVLKPHVNPRTALGISRVLVVFWSVVLCAVALLLPAVHERYGSILDLALAMATYTSGAVVAVFFLALLPTGRDGRGVPWSSALSVAAVLMMAWPEEHHRAKLHVGLALLAMLWVVVQLSPHRRGSPIGRQLIASGWFGLGLLCVLAIGRYGHALQVDPDGGVDESIQVAAVAYPWFVLIGTAVAFVFGYLLGDPNRPLDKNSLTSLQHP